MIDIRVGKHNGAVPSHLNSHIPITHLELQEYQQELSKPIRFIWVNGQVKSFEAYSQEPEWSINMKKSILSLLNVNLNPRNLIQTLSPLAKKQNDLHPGIPLPPRQPNEQLIVYPIYEDGIGGICETLYEMKQSQDPWQQLQTTSEQQNEVVVLNVTKTRVYDNCLTRLTIEKSNVDVRGAPVGCKNGKPFPAVAGYYPLGAEDAEQQQDGIAPQTSSCAQGEKIQNSPVNQFNFVKYNISKKPNEPAFQIESILGEGKTVLNSNGRQIILIVQQNISLEQVLPSVEFGQIKQIENGIVSISTQNYQQLLLIFLPI